MNTTLLSNDQVPNHQLCLNCLICLMNNPDPTTSDLGKINKVSNGLRFLLQMYKESLICPVDSVTMISIDVSFIKCSHQSDSIHVCFLEFDLNLNYGHLVKSVCVVKMLYLSNKSTTFSFVRMILFRQEGIRCISIDLYLTCNSMYFIWPPKS